MNRVIIPLHQPTAPCVDVGDSFRFCEAPIHVIKENGAFTRDSVQRRRSTGKIERKLVLSRTKSTCRTPDRTNSSSSRLGQMLADLGMMGHNKCASAKAQSMDKSSTFARTHFLKASHLEEASGHTSATEDLSSSSAWAHSEVNLKEFKPSLPPRKLSFKSYMENIKQKHIKKLKLIQAIETLDEKLDELLKKCHETKAKLSILEKVEACDSLLSDSDDESSLSGDFSLSSDESESFYSESSDDEEEE